jgi:hypothetical protein
MITRVVLRLAIILAIVCSAVTAWSSPQPVVFIQTRVEYPQMVGLSGQVRNAVIPPRLGSARGLTVQTQDSSGTVLDQYARFDLRVHTPEGGAFAPVPFGTRRLLSARIVPGSRWVRVYGGDALVMEYDLGPDLVSACADGTLSESLCSTFDSDGDGCSDGADNDPLLPEAEPPSLSVAISPRSIWPPNHRFVPISVAISVTDNCSRNSMVWLDSISSSEPESGVTAGDVGPDIVDAAYGSFDTSFSLRAERWGISRTYYVTYAARDNAGNITRSTITVLVPHYQGQL